MSKIKPCSILGYLRHADEDLHELIQDLCAGKMLMPRKGSAGITFLRPDAGLRAEIRKLAESDDPEKAIEALQSLVIVDHLATPADFAERKDDIPTMLRKKLVVEVSGQNITSGKAKIQLDKNFHARQDRSNLAVYVIDQMPTLGDVTETVPKARPAKKGGADLSGSRAQLFERVIADYCAADCSVLISGVQDKVPSRDPAMELIIALHNWSSKNNKEVAAVIKSQCSFDTLASLACILQPYKQVKNYITDQEWSEFVSAMHGLEAFQSSILYTYDENAADKYAELATSEFKEVADKIQELSQDVSSGMSKVTAVKKVESFYRGNDVKSILSSICSRRCDLTPKELFAESELRVMSAMIIENSSDLPSAHELIGLFRNCKLDSPYICADKELIQSANLGFYYSTIYLICRSDCLLYVPGIKGESTSNIVNEGAFIGINSTFENVEWLKNRRVNSANAIKKLKAKIADAF